MLILEHRRSSIYQALAGVSILFLAAVAAGCAGSAAEGIPGAELYGACTPCHGELGQGNVAVSAPRIAGLPDWYVASQLQRFQTGLRGEHPDDVEGLRMRAMSKQMMSDAEIHAVAAHVAGLPKVTNAAARTDANPAAGQALFATCTACHGMNGEGNRDVNAPPIAGLDDWYIELQLQKFRAGVRGTVPNDAIGPVMRAMSLAIPPEMVNDVAAYVHSLPQQP